MATDMQRGLMRAMMVLLFLLFGGTILISPLSAGGQQEEIHPERAALDASFAPPSQFKPDSYVVYAVCDSRSDLRDYVNTAVNTSNALPGSPDPVPQAPACPACSVPCDSRLVCRQYAIHYEPCSNTRDCGGRADYREKHRCSRCCWPNTCSCAAWSQTSLGCVYDPGCELRDSCQSCSDHGGCPAAVSGDE